MAGKHPRNALNPKKIAALKEPGRYADGGGLYLVVTPNGTRQWILRTVVKGRRRDMGLGSAQLVSLADARDLALKYRRIARNGGDPILERRKADMQVPTFSEAAKQVHKERLPTWKNAKHAAQWLSTLEEYAYPVLGDLPVSDIESGDVLKVLLPIWNTKEETARRVRQRIGTVLDWAAASNYRAIGNPTHAIAKALPKQKKKVVHHKALPYADVPDALKLARAADAMPSVRLGLEFLILTVSRTGEVLEATWDEVDLKKKIWTVPEGRMKSEAEHRVPLSDRCVEILAEARKLDPDSPFIFPGRSRGKPLSNMALLSFLQGTLNLDTTTHGFRASFRDWAGEQTNYPREVCERALAHSNKDRVEAAYKRTDFLEKRRALMDDWAQFVCLDRMQ